MTWLTIIQLVLKLADGLVRYAGDRQLLNAGEAKAIAENLSASRDVLDKALRARNTAGADFDKRGGVPDDKDPNLRD